MLRLTRFTDDADYDSGETSGNLPNARCKAGNNHGNYASRFQTRFLRLGLSDNTAKLLKTGQTLICSEKRLRPK
ncbi:unnamed protein product [Protopolystoma xenopodis]|uniref:Uncharacterized protein n=1 Tax=Protopolystoma xenopodis TaxID=117903 RepID=A0A448X0B3_9PLAT|nr:unnamed protein product [Protopolystoma xenopodis]